MGMAAVTSTQKKGTTSHALAAHSSVRNSIEVLLETGGEDHGRQVARVSVNVQTQTRAARVSRLHKKKYKRGRRLAAAAVKTYQDVRDATFDGEGRVLIKEWEQ